MSGNFWTKPSTSATFAQANNFLTKQRTAQITPFPYTAIFRSLKTLTGSHAYTITVTDATVAAADLNTIDAATTVVFTATAVTTLTGTGTALAAALTSAGITLSVTEAVTVTGTASIAELTAIDG